MFALDEKVVYPGHGVATIARIIEKKVGTHIVQFFELKFLNKDMTILIPVDNLSSVGLRSLTNTKAAEEVFKMLSEPCKTGPSEPVASNWSKRNKEYQGKLRSGNLQDIGKIYRDLQLISTHKELSFGEKALLQQTELLLAQELALVKKMTETSMVEHLRQLCIQVRLMAQPVVDHSVGMK